MKYKLQTFGNTLKLCIPSKIIDTIVIKKEHIIRSINQDKSMSIIQTDYKTITLAKTTQP